MTNPERTFKNYFGRPFMLLFSLKEPTKKTEKV